MTFVGRILVVVIVLLSVCVAAFTATAYSVQQNWKLAYETEVAENDATTEKNRNIETGLNNQITALTSERGQLQIDLGASQGREGRTKQERDSLADQNEKRQASIDQLQEENRLVIAEKERSVEKAKNLLAQLGDVQKQLDTMGDEKRDLQDQVYTLNKKNIDFANRHHILLLASGESQALLQKCKIRLGKVEFQKIQYADTPPPVVEGRVTFTKSTDRGKTVLVEISIGEDDGLKIGHKIDVHRNNGKPKFLGTITVTGVTADKAVGILDLDTKNGIIEKGDHVTTQL